ncbi:MAG: uracil-DNA glycosylase [Candidatus Binatia bacterium]|nr:uracil-DNA glycosylase [Candidatus Binatia bacterium]
MSQVIRSLARDLAAHVEWMALSGVDELTPSLAWPRGEAAEATPELPGAAAAEPQVAVRPDEAVAGGLAATDLGALRSELGDCSRCRLSATRTQIVFGTGNPDARIVFVGEGPGRDEDQQGQPFVGRAGALLTDIIEKGMKIDRSEVYICNVVKCRPPDNRNPEPEEVSACSPFLIRQIELVKPEVIVALGKFAAQTLLQTTRPITRLRGEWHEYHGIALMPTFHPAHLLRNPSFKRQVWEDIQQVMQRLGMAGG